MGREDKYPWIDDLFDGQRITFPEDPDKGVWELTKKITEASQQYEAPCESRAVYHCRQVEGQSKGMEAIMKVRMQIPSTRFPHRLSQERAKHASEELNFATENEIEALELLTAAKCSCTPKLLSWKRELQDDTMPVPGGYVVYILMEKLPGVPPFNLFSEGCFTLEQRDEVRREFRKALMEVHKHGIFPMDAGAQNLLWDEKGRKCYIVDFEEWVEREEEEREVWHDSRYFSWGLVSAPATGERKW